MKQPLVYDLCCGLGGWADGFLAEGWRVVGVDLSDFSSAYPGQFVQADLLEWPFETFQIPDFVVGSPPCDEFARYSMPWTRARNPPAPSLALWNRCEEIAKESRCRYVVENVRGAQQFMGRSQVNCGPFHLWGDGVPAILPVYLGKKKESWSGKDKAERAKIPFELARFVAQCASRIVGWKKPE